MDQNSMETFRQKLESLRKLQQAMQEKYSRPQYEETRSFQSTTPVLSPVFNNEDPVVQPPTQATQPDPPAVVFPASPAAPPADRKDKLRKIDADLVAVEEALERRRRSLAEIDQKLNDLQPQGKSTPLATPPRAQESMSEFPPMPTSNGLASVSQVAHQPICTRLDSAASALDQAASRKAKADGSFADWLQEHKNYCNAVQKARKEQEGQEFVLRQKHQQLQSQLVSLHNALDPGSKVGRAMSPTVGASPLGTSSTRRLVRSRSSDAFPMSQLDGQCSARIRGPPKAMTPLLSAAVTPALMRSRSSDVLPTVGPPEANYFTQVQSHPPVVYAHYRSTSFGSRGAPRGSTPSSAASSPRHRQVFGAVGPSPMNPQVLLPRSVSTPALALDSSMEVSSTTRTPTTVVMGTPTRPLMGGAVASARDMPGLAQSNRGNNSRAPSVEPGLRAATPVRQLVGGVVSSARDMRVSSQNVESTPGSPVTSKRDITDASIDHGTPSTKTPGFLGVGQQVAGTVGQMTASFISTPGRPIELSPSRRSRTPSVEPTSRMQQFQVVQPLLLPVPQPQLPLPPQLCFYKEPPPRIPSFQAVAQPGSFVAAQQGILPQFQPVSSPPAPPAPAIQPERDSFVPHPKNQGPTRDSFDDPIMLQDPFRGRSMQSMQSFSQPTPAPAAAPALPRVNSMAMPPPRSNSIASLAPPPPPPPPPQANSKASATAPLSPQSSGVVEQPNLSLAGASALPEQTKAAGRASGSDFRSSDFPVHSQTSPLGYPQSFRGSFNEQIGSAVEGLEQWKPPPSVASFQLRTEAALAGPQARGPSAPNATYHGPQPIPKAQQQCPVQ